MYIDLTLIIAGHIGLISSASSGKLHLKISNRTNTSIHMGNFSQLKEICNDNLEEIRSWCLFLNDFFNCSHFSKIPYILDNFVQKMFRNAKKLQILFVFTTRLENFPKIPLKRGKIKNFVQNIDGTMIFTLILD